MRNIPAPLQTHIASEVTSLTRCIKITKADGTILRLTMHDSNLVFSGDTYLAGVPMDISALQSSDTLAVDNAELTVGIDGTIITQVDLDSGQFDNAVFELFIVNWENPGDGAIYLKKGTLGDIEIVNNVTATIQLRGLTQSLQRPIVERYSPTCRVNLGGPKCGVVNSPVKLRRPNQKVKTFDWYLVPQANTTTVVVDNSSFESANITDAGWIIPEGSAWIRAADFAAEAGNWYAEGGTGVTGQELVLYQDFDLVAGLGMDSAQIDLGSYSFDMSVQVARTSDAIRNTGKIYIEQYDVNGNTLRREDTAYAVFDYQSWQGIGLTVFIVPGARSLRIGLSNRIDSGTAGHVAFDAITCQYFLNQADTWGGAAFRTVKLPAFASDEKISLPNFSFESNGAVANTNTPGAITNWTLTAGNWWKVATALGTLHPTSGSYLLAGGDNGSTLPSQVYEINRVVTLANDVWAAQATPENITDGWYYAQLNVDAGRSDSDSAPRIILEYLDNSNVVLASEDSGYIATLTTGVMQTQKIGSRVPAGATKIKIRLLARSGTADSAANVAFDDVNVFFFPTAYEHVNDPELANLALTQPTYDYTQQNYTRDGAALSQARPLIFGYASVTELQGDNRSFSASDISNTAARMYSGRVTWLSGANAGRVSFIRIWDDTLKTAKLYETLPNDIQVGDKFVYAQGCDKTIDRCFELGNVHNMRAEPYLPGPNKVISFLVAENPAK